MMRSKNSILMGAIATLVLLNSCSSTSDVVQDGLFQKRKYYNKGWFVDLPSKTKAKLNKQAPKKDKIIAEKMHVVTIHPNNDLAPTPMNVVAQKPTLVGTHKETGWEELAAKIKPATNGQGNGLSKKRTFKELNLALRKAAEARMPIPNNVGGIDLFALLGFIFAFIIPIAGLILSIIGMGRTTPGGGEGYGLAFAGAIISAVTMVIVFTLIL